jgi:galactokinase
MPEKGYWERRLGGKAAERSYKELYGRQGAEGQAARYARLASRVEADAGAASDSEAARAGYRFYSASGRTELGGNHTDHNRGRVLCAAVGLDTVACVAPNGGGAVSLKSEGFEPVRVDLGSLAPVTSERGTTAALVRGIAACLAERGIPLRGFDCATHSSVPPGSGLSSSAAIEVLVGTIMADLAGAVLPPLEIARIGQRAENDWFGKPCGLMDQAASAMGGIVAIDFADPDSPEVERIECDFDEAGFALVIVNTGGSHADLTADYASVPAEMNAVAAELGAERLREVDPAALVARGPEIRKACGDRALLRAFHFAAENARVQEMAEALRGGDLGAYLKLVKKSGRSSWELLQNLYPTSAPREQGIPLALELSSMFIGKEGAWRVHGGGFAGTIQAYVPKRLYEGYEALMERYFGPGCAVRISVRPRGALKLDI